MSHAAPCGRGAPRWSVAGQPTFVPASIAGLPGKSACVGVGPPLFFSGPSRGSVLAMVAPQLSATTPPYCKLFPLFVTTLEQLSGAPNAMMLFVIVTAPLWRAMLPPLDALLYASVLF